MISSAASKQNQNRDVGPLWTFMLLLRECDSGPLMSVTFERRTLFPAVLAGFYGGYRQELMFAGPELSGWFWCRSAGLMGFCCFTLFSNRALARRHQFRIKQFGVRKTSRRSPLKFQLPLLWLAHVIRHSHPEHVA